MISRRGLFGGLAGLTVPALAGCGGTPPKGSSFASLPPAPPPAVRPGLDAVIDISHNVTVSDFRAVRRSNILSVIHKVTEGGDWFDPSYGSRRADAEAAGLLWGGYHFGTRQYSGEQQAAAFLSACRPGPSTLMALDLEPNDRNPRNTMTLAQAEAFVRAVHRATGRLPMVYTHAAWANGEKYGRRGLRLDRPVTPSSILARCDLWLAEYREQQPLPAQA
jgi:lysozyme